MVDDIMKLRMIAIGKIRSRPVQEIVDDYLGRIGHYAPIDVVVARDDAKAIASIEPGDYVVVLDVGGRQMSSEDLSRFLSKHMGGGARRIAFVIGGQDGIGDKLMRRANFKLSFSLMTFPHELMQAILTEQIYRAYTIMKGEPYHRGSDKR